jgi:hypothetical protein
MPVKQASASEMSKNITTHTVLKMYFFSFVFIAVFITKRFCGPIGAT